MNSCPICDVTLEMPGNTLAGELKDCDECGSELEVISINPFVLNEAPQVEEDWGE